MIYGPVFCSWVRISHCYIASKYVAWRKLLSGKNDLLSAILIVGVIGFIGGGWTAVKIVYIASFILICCLFFWVYSYKFGKKVSNKFKFLGAFKTVYYSLLALFVAAVFIWILSNDTGYCPPGTYGDIVCNR